MKADILNPDLQKSKDLEDAEGYAYSFQELQDYLDGKEFKKQYPKAPKVNVLRDIIPVMKDMVIDSHCQFKLVNNPNGRKHSHQYYAYDFMLDDDFRVWLLEVNT